MLCANLVEKNNWTTSVTHLRHYNNIKDVLGMNKWTEAIFVIGIDFKSF